MYTSIQKAASSSINNNKVPAIKFIDWQYLPYQKQTTNKTNKNE